MKAGVNSWVVDTEAGHNLVPRSGLTQIEEQKLPLSNKALRLRTENGVIELNDIATSNINELGTQVIARVLESTTRLLSVHQLLETEDASFSWTPYEGTILTLGGESASVYQSNKEFSCYRCQQGKTL